MMNESEMRQLMELSKEYTVEEWDAICDRQIMFSRIMIFLYASSIVAVIACYVILIAT